MSTRVNQYMSYKYFFYWWDNDNSDKKVKMSRAVQCFSCSLYTQCHFWHNFCQIIAKECRNDGRDYLVYHLYKM